MITTSQRSDVMTVEEFDQWVMLPENADKNFEYIGGRIVEVSSNIFSSRLAALLTHFILSFVIEHELGSVTSSDGGFHVMGERYTPDVGFISFAKQPDPPFDGYNKMAPDLAVEVLSPGNKDADMQIKIANYLKAGTTTWLFDPIRHTVEIHVPGEPVKTLGIDDTLDGGAVLPGFTLSIRKLFHLANPKNISADSTDESR